MNLERSGSDVKLYYHELKGNNIMECNEAVNKFVAFIIYIGNPYSALVNHTRKVSASKLEGD